MSNLFGILGHLITGGGGGGSSNPNGYQSSAPVGLNPGGFYGPANAQQAPDSQQNSNPFQKLLQKQKPQQQQVAQQFQQPPAQLQQSNQPMYMSYDGYLTNPGSNGAVNLPSADVGYSGGDT